MKDNKENNDRNDNNEEKENNTRKAEEATTSTDRAKTMPKHFGGGEPAANAWTAWDEWDRCAMRAPGLSVWGKSPSSRVSVS